MYMYLHVQGFSHLILYHCFDFIDCLWTRGGCIATVSDTGQLLAIILLEFAVGHPA